MTRIMVTRQGRELCVDTDLIERLLAENPGWGRSRLSVRLCELWNWRGPNGQIKDIACRSLLLRLERAGHLRLPPPQSKSPNASRNRGCVLVPHATDPIEGGLKALLPLRVSCVRPGSAEDGLFRCLLARYHYLGLKNTVGESMRYMLYARDGRPLACLLFGSAAWKSAARDPWLGWSPQARRRNLPLLTNNTRFLILPWVRVPHLASHVLSRVTRRVAADWMGKYGHPVVCLETFVDRSRYRGTCYQAANWHRVGQSAGRGRNDRHHRCEVSPKDVYLYPLARDFRGRLRHDA